MEEIRMMLITFYRDFYQDCFILFNFFYRRTVFLLLEQLLEENI